LLVLLVIGHGPLLLLEILVECRGISHGTAAPLSLAVVGSILLVLIKTGISRRCELAGSYRLLSCGHLAVAGETARLLPPTVLVEPAECAGSLAKTGKAGAGLHAGGKLLGDAANPVKVLAYLITHLLNALQLLCGGAFMLLQPGKLGSIVLFGLLKLVCHLLNAVEFLAHFLELLLQLIELVHKLYLL